MIHTHRSFFQDERLRYVLCACMAWMFAAPSLSAQARVEQNVVYGMYSGLAVLMDVHHPAEPNGVGVILIWGSGWHGPTTYDARQLKRGGAPKIFLDVGYTVFVINHRNAPRFRYPAAVEDVQRAVRFVRYHAQRFGIDPDRLGGFGYSSGAHLISLLGLMDGDGDANDGDPVNRESAKLQAVVARAAPTDLTKLSSPAVVSFLGSRPGRGNPSYREASPITYVTPDDPPFLLIHGDADPTVPFGQAELMLAALEEKSVEARLIRIAGGGHGASDLPETARWLNRHLLGEPKAQALESVIAANVAEGERCRDLTTETSRSPNEVIGVAETALTMEGELPTASRWTAEVYRWATAADVGFAHQWPPSPEFTPGDIRVEDLFDAFACDSVYTFRLTGLQLRRMIEFNIRQTRSWLHVGLAGIHATFELHEDPSKNRVIEWGLDDDSTYTVAGDLHEPNALRNFLGFIPEWTPAGLTAFQAAIRWFETHNQVRDMPSWIRIVRRR